MLFRSSKLKLDADFRPDGWYGLSKVWGEAMARMYWDKHGIEGATEAAERIERAVDKAYADGIKPTEFGGSNGTADIAKAVLAAL